MLWFIIAFKSIINYTLLDQKLKMLNNEAYLRYEQPTFFLFVPNLNFLFW